MRHIILFTLLITILIPDMKAYRRYGLIGKRIKSEGSIVFNNGPSYCYGETYGLPTKRSVFNRTNFETSLGFRQYFPGNFGYKADFFYGNYTSQDGSNNAKRDYGSITNTFGLSARAEYAYYFGGNYRYRTPNQHSVYGFLGFGVINCSISPYNTKRDPIPHSVEPILPFGLGYNFAINDDLLIGLEVGWKYSFSDYIDGYHSPIYSKYNDVIGGISLNVAYRIFGRKGFLGH